MKYPLIIFDWDGTLMDSVGRIVSSMQHTAVAMNLPVPPVTAVREIIGISLEPAIEQLFGRMSATALAQFKDLYRQEYVFDNQTPSPFFAGALTALEQLKQQGYTLAVATGKARHGLERIWQAESAYQLFHSSRCADETASKPNPKMLHEIMAETGFSAQQTLMVGDSIHDMKMAENAQVARLGVSFGAHASERLQCYQPIAILDDFETLPAYV